MGARMEAMLTLGAYVKMFYYVGLKMRFPIIFVWEADDTSLMM